jgi:hypothetical protein
MRPCRKGKPPTQPRPTNHSSIAPSVEGKSIAAFPRARATISATVASRQNTEGRASGHLAFQRWPRLRSRRPLVPGNVRAAQRVRTETLGIEVHGPGRGVQVVVDLLALQRVVAIPEDPGIQRRAMPSTRPRNRSFGSPQGRLAPFPQIRGLPVRTLFPLFSTATCPKTAQTLDTYVIMESWN